MNPMVAPGASWMPIGELSRRLGVSTDVLRKWERRYSVLRPGRTTGNQRLYSRVDEARARVMVGHLRDGMPAAQAAQLAIAARFRTTANARPRDERADDARTAMQAALELYDETAADLALENMLAQRPATIVIRDIFLPYLRELGERWADGEITVAEEHFASGFIHGRLLGLARGWDRALGQRALLACAPGEQHTFGLISFGIALHQLGWGITYLGADTPVPMIAKAATHVAPRLIVVYAANCQRLEPVVPQLRKLAANWTLALGGGTSPELADRCGASRLANDPITAADHVFV